MNLRHVMTICDSRDAAKRIIGEARLMSGSYSLRSRVLDAIEEALAEGMANAQLTMEQIESLERRIIGVLYRLDVAD